MFFTERGDIKADNGQPRWLSWMRRPTGDQGVVEIDHEIFSTVILSLPLIEEGNCQFLAKECAQYWLTA